MLAAARKVAFKDVDGRIPVGPSPLDKLVALLQLQVIYDVLETVLPQEFGQVVVVVEHLSLRCPFLWNVCFLFLTQRPELLVNCEEEPELSYQLGVVGHYLDAQVVLVVITQQLDGQRNFLAVDI